MKIIVYAWVNDEQTLRSAGSKTDPYGVFEKMPGRGRSPDDWDALVRACQQDGGNGNGTSPDSPQTGRP